MTLRMLKLLKAAEQAARLSRVSNALLRAQPLLT